ncbi:hypothetical protein CALVIDRAFT_204639 [Calocera viscosa TUFC12733]|uniref:Uncharacterized protein n=1 Tax=Calocera viscosa (strain TUFC12733) TaxID=1330018 RepID=A0A167KCW4_CALVF|nr:hypothetical protein CALVIDRAFT_204639 [Calocera viscosa TUFC12733]
MIPQVGRSHLPIFPPLPVRSRSAQKGSSPTEAPSVERVDGVSIGGLPATRSHPPATRSHHSLSSLPSRQMPMQTRSKRSTTVEQVERSSRVKRVKGSFQSLAKRPRKLSMSRVEPDEGSSPVTHSPDIFLSRTELIHGSSSDMYCASINTLPVEIVRDIIRLATEVPVAFDTRSESVLDENRVATRRLIIESIKTKTSLSIVSKLFHIVADEYLYETLLLTKFPGCASLRRFAAFLRKKRRGVLRSRGERVRRLELNFFFHTYEWTTSWDSLWGLLPACPNLEALLFHLRSYPDLYFRRTICCSEQFARNIARRYGRTLRNFEMGEAIEFPQHCIQPMLACLESLEVIYVCGNGHHTPNPRASKQWTGMLPTGNRVKHLHTILGEILRLEGAFHSLPRLRHISLNKSYVPPTVLDLLRLHAGSIVSLYYAQNILSAPLPVILETLPNLEHLLVQDYRNTAWDKVLPTQGHSKLRILTVFLIYSLYEERTMLSDMESLLHTVEEGCLPQFKKIRLGGLLRYGHRQGLPELGETWSRLGITWEERPDLKPMHGSL